MTNTNYDLNCMNYTWSMFLVANKKRTSTLLYLLLQSLIGCIKLLYQVISSSSEFQLFFALDSYSDNSIKSTVFMPFWQYVLAMYCQFGLRIGIKSYKSRDYP